MSKKYQYSEAAFNLAGLNPTNETMMLMAAHQAATKVLEQLTDEDLGYLVKAGGEPEKSRHEMIEILIRRIMRR
jgi:hypothetical protein